MFRKHKCLIKGIAAIALFMQPVSQATPLCTYEIHSPNVFAQGIVHQLADVGVAAIVNTRTLTDTYREYNVFQAHNVQVGRIVYEKSLISRASQVIFQDANGFIIAQARETIYPCPVRNPRGRCYDTGLYTVFDGLDPNLEAPFLVRDGLYGMEWYRYGNETGPVTWRSEYQATIDWLVDFYYSTSERQVFESADPLQQISFSINSDPLLAPFADYLTVYQVRGRHVVSGVVPSNAHFNAVIDIFFDAGIYNVQPNIVIDTGLSPPLQPYLPMIERCL